MRSRDTTTRKAISPEEEAELWQAFKNENSFEARETLANKYIHLVKYVINRLLSASHIESEVLDYDDLFSCGVMGLLAALDNFDLSRNVKFITYAIPRIRGSIIDELRSVDWIPRSLRQRVNQLQATFQEVEQELQRPATDTEVADRLGVDSAVLSGLLQDASRAALLSLDEILRISDESSATRGEMTPAADTEDPRRQIQKEEIVEVLTIAIENLPEKERLVVVMYYNEELTLREIGEVLGVTESRVCQLHTKAMMRLRGRLTSIQHDLFV
ncbi:MAG TPA: FliA/WhiG family RNA polymerase sigma factor [bacterium]|nr:FliA/WhiG family RNA polymerase sigma factor [bacterium]HPO09726.1 FliA/WhiG family RNA polymerase sigma factor [bacterium]HQO34466.1 FliA/WhiG family RNA polymerase sigma factor [bacterium]HQP98387.1 FliA/WhiG family RNA polymerase sigma factor [bacterium]